MRVATWHGENRFRLDRVPDPAPSAGGVVVRVDTVGICGTDVHITQGLVPATPPRSWGTSSAASSPPRHPACEAVGKPELVGAAVAVTRPRGTVLLVGVNPPGSRLPVDLYDLHYREVVLRGAFGRGTAFARTLRLLPGLGLEALITTRYPLDQVTAAMAAAATGRGVKTVLAPQLQASGQAWSPP